MRLLIFGDSKGERNGINEEVLKAILKESSKLQPKPEAIVMCGDTVAGSSSKEVLFSQLTNLRALISQYYKNTLLIPVIGNHEVNINPVDDSFETVFSSIYSDTIKNNFLENYNRTVYFVDFPYTRLFVLNAFHNGETHRVPYDQLAWLMNAASGFSGNKLLFVHSPAFPTGAHLGHCLDRYEEQRDVFWKTVESCSIDMVFSGHEHNYSRRIIRNSFNSPKKTSFHIHSNKDSFGERGIYQIISGGGGEKLKHKYKSKEGVVVAPIAEHHYIIADIEMNFIKISSFNLKGKILDHFSLYK